VSSGLAIEVLVAVEVLVSVLFQGSASFGHGLAVAAASGSMFGQPLGVGQRWWNAIKGCLGGCCRVLQVDVKVP
jgi:hypothetical protein